MKYVGTKKIETERLILRRLNKDDALEAFNNWCSIEEVSKYVLWNKHENVLETLELFSMWEKDYEDLATFRWIVEIKDTHELIGTIDVVSKKDLVFGTCEIGYCYGVKFWGKGYATEALKAVIKYLFEECEVETIYARHLSNNPASGKVMKKAGMYYEGILRSRYIDKDNKRNDLICYSILKDEFFNNI